MKWMLATILSVVMVAPAFASVDITLVSGENTDLIQFPAGTTFGTLTLKLGLGNYMSEGEGGVAGYNAALGKVAVVGAGTFKIQTRAAGTIPAGISPMVLNVTNSALSPTSADVGGYNGTTGMWEAIDLNDPAKNTMNVFTIAFNDVKDMDEYKISVVDPVGGKVIVSDENGMPLTVGALGSVTVKILPEPASLLLLALGGLFLRRRHA